MNFEPEQLVREKILKTNFLKNLKILIPLGTQHQAGYLGQGGHLCRSDKANFPWKIVVRNPSFKNSNF